jgi:hypothetical protein
VQKEAALRRSLKNYDAAVFRLQSQLDLLRERYGIHAESLRLKSERNVIENTAAGIINGAKLTQKIAASVTAKWRRFGEIAVEGVPKVAGLANDITAPLRASLLLNAETLAETSRYVEYGAYGVEIAATTAKKRAPLPQ